MRLNLFVAKAAGLARRKADLAVQHGKVTVNGVIVQQPFVPVGEKDKVTLSGKLLNMQAYVYLMLNKPRGVTTTKEDQFAAKTVMEVLPEQFRGLFPVGRLDRESSGLLLLTNDGDFCQKVTHPKFEVEKDYFVVVSGMVDEAVAAQAKKGVKFEDEFLKVQGIKLISSFPNRTLLRVVIKEGKKRHIRHLFQALGCQVRELKRMRVGGLYLDNLEEGKYKVITRSMAERAMHNPKVRDFHPAAKKSVAADKPLPKLQEKKFTSRERDSKPKNRFAPKANAFSSFKKV